MRPFILKHMFGAVILGPFMPGGDSERPIAAWRGEVEGGQIFGGVVKRRNVGSVRGNWQVVHGLGRREG